MTIPVKLKPSISKRLLHSTVFSLDIIMLQMGLLLFGVRSLVRLYSKSIKIG